MLIALAVAWLIFLTIFVVECLRAPLGYEDKDGFHFSKSPQIPSVIRKPRRRQSRGMTRALH